MQEIASGERLAPNQHERECERPKSGGRRNPLACGARGAYARRGLLEHAAIAQLTANAEAEACRDCLETVP